MKPADVRSIERASAKKSRIEMAIALLRDADTMFCGKNVHDAIYLLEQEAMLLDEELQSFMD